MPGLPVRYGGDLADLDGGYLVFRAIRRPIRVVCGYDIRAGLRMMKRGVEHTGLHPLGYICA